MQLFHSKKKVYIPIFSLHSQFSFVYLRIFFGQSRTVFWSANFTNNNFLLFRNFSNKTFFIRKLFKLRTSKQQTPRACVLLIKAKFVCLINVVCWGGSFYFLKLNKHEIHWWITRCLNDITHRNIFSKSYQTKPKSDGIYHAPIDLCIINQSIKFVWLINVCFICWGVCFIAFSSYTRFALNYLHE